MVIILLGKSKRPSPKVFSQRTSPSLVIFKTQKSISSILDGPFIYSSQVIPDVSVEPRIINSFDELIITSLKKLLKEGIKIFSQRISPLLLNLVKTASCTTSGSEEPLPPTINIFPLES